MATQPQKRRNCNQCIHAYGDWPGGHKIVSPKGTVHIPQSFGGLTLCGRDANAPGWWRSW